MSRANQNHQNHASSGPQSFAVRNKTALFCFRKTPEAIISCVRQYHDLLRLVLDQGRPRADRTGTGTLSVFGAQARFDLRDNFPLLTTKKLHIKSIIYELLWFLRGERNVRSLQENKVTIWDEWADKTTRSEERRVGKECRSRSS